MHDYRCDHWHRPAKSAQPACLSNYSVRQRGALQEGASYVCASRRRREKTEELRPSLGPPAKTKAALPCTLSCCREGHPEKEGPSLLTPFVFQMAVSSFTHFHVRFVFARLIIRSGMRTRCPHHLPFAGPTPPVEWILRTAHVHRCYAQPSCAPRRSPPCSAPPGGSRHSLASSASWQPLFDAGAEGRWAEGLAGSPGTRRPLPKRRRPRLHPWVLVAPWGSSVSSSLEKGE